MTPEHLISFVPNHPIYRSGKKKQSYSAPGSKPWLKFIEYQDKKARLTTHVSTIDEYGEQLIQERLTYKHEHDIELKPLADYHGTMPKHVER